nr:splicing factor [Tanacetum cinerariifolium]
MEERKYFNIEAYGYLIQRNPNTWCRVFFKLDTALENWISESYHKAILLQRSKPIITMLEDIRIYVMQRLVVLNKLVTNLEEEITPTVRKKLEFFKEEQRKMLRRPKKSRIKAPDENNSQVSRIGKQIRCSNYQGVGHNKSSRDKETVPKPPIVKKVPGRRREADLQPASFRGGGRGSRGGGRVSTPASRGVVEEHEVVPEEEDVVAGEQEVVVEVQEVVYVFDILGKEYQEKLDEEAFREAIKEEAM